jgi:CHAD domain-containing protein
MPADTPLGEYAARVIEVRAGEVEELAGRVTDRGQVDLVHDRRVAIRRLRTAIEVFEPALPRKAAKSARRDLKDVFATLGARRDADVALAALAELEPRLTAADRAGYKGLAERIDREGAGAGPVDLGALVEGVQAARAVAEKGRANGGPAAGSALRKSAARRIADLRAGLDALRDPADAEAVHALRKSAKRLRYVLEAGEPVLGSAGADGADAARELQDTLGVLHDSDVLVERIRAHRGALRTADVVAARAREPLPSATPHRGVQVVDALVRAHRADLRGEVAARRDEFRGRFDEITQALVPA